MRLSDEARRLMLEGKMAELLALPFEKLVHQHDVDEYNALFSREESEETPLHSLATELIDAVTFDTIKDAVVTSSGHIFSQNTILRSMRFFPKPTCPLTRQPLSMLPSDAWYVALPKVNEAIEKYREF